MFFMIYVSSFIIVLSCSEWIMIWLGLEINMISFIMMIYNKYNLNNIESCLKYFFIQSIGSVFLLMMFYLNLEFKMFFSMVLCYKIGGGIFYFWFPSMCEMISVWSCFMLMVFQKIIPLMLLSLMLSKIMWMMSFISLLVGVLGSMNQVKMKRLLAYSSIHHIGWLLMSLMVKDNLWINYLMIYMMMMINFFIFLEMKNINEIFDLTVFKDKLLMIFMLLNMGGIPPMLGFFLKWWFFYYMMEFNYFIVIMLIVFSVMMLYVYFRLSYDYLMKSSVQMFSSMKIQMEKIIQFDVFMFFSIFMSMLGLMLII